MSSDRNESVKKIEVAPVKSEPIQYDQEGYPLIRVDFTTEMPVEIIKAVLYQITSFVYWWSLNRVCKKLHTLIKRELAERRVIVTGANKRDANDIFADITILPCGRCCLRKYYTEEGYPERLSHHIHLNYKECKLDGIARIYATDRKLTKQAYYVNDVLEGYLEERDSTGMLMLLVKYSHGEPCGDVYIRSTENKNIDIQCTVIHSETFPFDGFSVIHGNCVVTNKGDDTRIQCTIVNGVLDGDMRITRGKNITCTITHDKGIRTGIKYIDTTRNETKYTNAGFDFYFKADDSYSLISFGRIRVKHGNWFNASEIIHEWTNLESITFRCENSYYYGNPKCMKVPRYQLPPPRPEPGFGEIEEENSDPDHDDNYYHEDRVAERQSFKRKQSPVVYSGPYVPPKKNE
jgi:antitoxin component YwqK of YwqJK toxin-antitoxin module